MTYTAALTVIVMLATSSVFMLTSGKMNISPERIIALAMTLAPLLVVGGIFLVMHVLFGFFFDVVGVL